MVASRENFPLLAELLAEQQRLDTPVARFSTAHDVASVSQLSAHSSQLSALAPQLIPLTAPSPGEQYAFEVDLDSCTGCKSCVAACHSLNGLDENETWRDVGLLVSPRRSQPFTQTITTACHHCADPACLNGCPVLAYEKDPITGVVVHLDDQCIGCSYCILKCPYDVPKFSERLGIVRKCDMCHSRLTEGEAPACAQACPTRAIRIVTVPVAKNRIPETEHRKDPAIAPVSSLRFPASDFLPAAPSPAYTQPTTRYISKRHFPEELVAGDHAALRPQPPHWPLVIMLTLLPVAVGFALAAAFLPSRLPQSVTYWITLSWMAGTAGLGASVFHLGQPLRAWRIFLGWRKSWLSREAIVFGGWFGVASLALMIPSLAAISAALGVLGLVCSAMIYIDTRRDFWRASHTIPRMFGIAALIPIALVAPRAAGLLLIFKLVWEARACFGQGIPARLQRGPLARSSVLRDLLGVLAVLLLLAGPGWLAFPALIGGEIVERYLFFRSVDAPKMPGMPA